MKAILLCVLLSVALACALTPREQFTEFQHKYHKVYASEEFLMRYDVFRENLKRVDEMNAGSSSPAFGVTKFMDLTPFEFKNMYLMKEPVNTQHLRAEKPYTPPVHNEPIPSSYDWRNKGAVTPVYNQGQCGSCWAFSTTGSVEGAWGIKKGSLVSLSEQNLVDCSSKYGNYGCNGGLMDNAFKYIIANKGIDTESSYQYTAKDGTCKFNAGNVGATISSYKDVGKSEAALQSAIQNVGPISVAIDASKSSFHFYSSGVYYEAACSSTRLDHGVLAVGFGKSTGDYYIVKNSWGADWGIQGYILMSRNRNNNCGIATMSSYPIV